LMQSRKDWGTNRRFGWELAGCCCKVMSGIWVGHQAVPKKGEYGVGRQARGLACKPC